MTGFTPLSSLAGGALIGLAAALLWLGAGRIAGISGIVAGAATGEASERSWRLAFLAGLVGALLLYQAAVARPAVDIAAGPMTLAVAGLLVGFGTRLGMGCTSGHGVCGIARLSRRSLVATCVFTAAGAATVFVVRHVVGV